ncbi:MAG: protein kinase [Clostridium sp.]|nr:protein kinase [Clostridium sp.]
MQSDATHLQPGAIVDGEEYTYTIARTLGQGAYGITYLAEARLKADRHAGTRSMALKEYFIKGVNGRQNGMVTCASDGSLFDNNRSKFINEAQNLENFNTSGIVKIYEAFEANNTSYFSMELISGGDLEQYISENGPLSAVEIKSFTRQLAKALRIMHRKNILHLDVRPSNVMMRDRDQLVLIDFGFSKQFDEEGRSASSLGVDTDLYRPLEQQGYRSDFSNGLPATLDTYALTATIYKMATKRDPLPQSAFDEEFPHKLLEEAGASAELVELLRKGLALRPKDRIQDMDEMLEYIERLPEASDTGNITHRGEAEIGERSEGSENSEGSDFSEGSENSEGSEAYSERGDGERKWKMLAIILMALILAIAGGYFWIRHKQMHRPEKTEQRIADRTHAENLEFVSSNGEEYFYTGAIDSTHTVAIPHGIGTGRYATGVYTGEYRHGMRQGKGVYDYDYEGHAHHFVGTFDNDRYAKGKLTLPDGMWYEGTFNREGRPESGTWHNGDGSVYAKIRNGK